MENAFNAGFFRAAPINWLIPKSDLFQLYDIALAFDTVGLNDYLNSYQVRFDAREAYFNLVWQFPAVTSIMVESGVRYS